MGAIPRDRSVSTRCVVSPVYVVTCDWDGILPCSARWIPVRAYNQGSENLARADAGRNGGWQVRPAFGKGSRTAPDLCPKHKPEPEVTT